PELYTLSLHDALPISVICVTEARGGQGSGQRGWPQSSTRASPGLRTLEIAAGNNAVALALCDDQRMRTTVLIVDDHDDFRESARDRKSTRLNSSHVSI